jgi:hypothetical protein
VPVALLAVAVLAVFHPALAPLMVVDSEPENQQLLHSPMDLDLVLVPLKADHTSVAVGHQHLAPVP